MILAISVAVLLSPLLFAVLVTSHLSLRAKVVVGAVCLFLLIALPVVFLVRFS